MPLILIGQIVRYVVSLINPVFLQGNTRNLVRFGLILGKKDSPNPNPSGLD